LTPANQNMWLVSTPAVDLPLIPCMHGGYNHINRQFQAKTSQHKNSNISKTTNPIESKFEDQLIPSFALRGWSAVTLEKIQYGWRPTSWKSLWYPNSHGWSNFDETWLADGNVIPMMMQRWKSKPEVEFQHGRHLFSETRSSNVSAMDWGISL